MFRDRLAREDVISYKRWVTKEIDPETLPLEQVNPNECQKCGAIKLMNTHHCSTCKKCVYLMDHHCFWTGNCVGYLTLKPFVLYNIYQNTLMIYQLYVMWTIAKERGLAHISFGYPDIFARLHVGEQDDIQIKKCLERCAGNFDLRCAKSCEGPSPINFDTVLDAAAFYPMVAGLIYNLLIFGMFCFVSLNNNTFIDVWKTGNYTHPTLPRRSLANWFLFIFNENTF